MLLLDSFGVHHPKLLPTEFTILFSTTLLNILAWQCHSTCTRCPGRFYVLTLRLVSINGSTYWKDLQAKAQQLIFTDLLNL